MQMGREERLRKSERDRFEKVNEETWPTTTSCTVREEHDIIMSDIFMFVILCNTLNCILSTIYKLLDLIAFYSYCICTYVISMHSEAQARPWML